MDEIHKSTLTKARELFVKDLLIDPILDELIAAEILSEAHAEPINSQPTPTTKIRSLLKILPFCGPNAFTGFIKALDSSNQMHLAKELERIEGDIRCDRGLPPAVAQSSSEEIEFGQSESQITINPEVPDGCMPAKDDECDEFYPVDPENPGYVLIINNKQFENNENTYRLGSSQDVKNLSRLFEDLNYQVECEEDLNAETMIIKLQNFANYPKLRKGSVCVVILMSHGLKGKIYGSDNNLIELSDIFEIFSNENLDGMPKLFIIQACRGHKKDKGISEVDGTLELMTGDMTDANSSTNSESLGVLTSLSKKTQIVDCIFAYSTFDDYVSFRTEETGSWFISVLCDVFREKLIDTNRKMSVLALLTRVNRMVVQKHGNNNDFTQMPKPEHTLLKTLFLK